MHGGAEEGCCRGLLRLAAGLMSALHALLGLLQQRLKVRRLVLALDGAWTRLVCDGDQKSSVSQHAPGVLLVLLGRVFLTQVHVAFAGQSLEAREAALEESVPIPPVPLEARLADGDHAAALPATTEEERDG